MWPSGKHCHLTARRSWGGSWSDIRLQVSFHSPEPCLGWLETLNWCECKCEWYDVVFHPAIKLQLSLSSERPVREQKCPVHFIQDTVDNNRLQNSLNRTTSSLPACGGMSDMFPLATTLCFIRPHCLEVATGEGEEEASGLHCGVNENTIRFVQRGAPWQ